MVLVGQVRQGCPSMAPLGPVQLKKNAKTFRKQNEKQKRK